MRTFNFLPRVSWAARAWFSVAMMAVMLLLAIGSGPVQANSPPPGIQASARWFTDRVDYAGDVGDYAAIAFDPGTGTPWISYYDATNTALKVAHYVGSGGNCGPNNDWYCEIVDNSGNVGMYSSIDVHPTDPGPLNTRRIGVAYYDADNSALKFAEYSCLPSCQWTIVTVQDSGSVGAPSYGQYASLKYTADGKPQIAFYMESSMFDDELNYAYRVSSGGNCGVGSAAGKWHCETVDSGNKMGQYTSIGESDFTGVAHIGYYNGGAGDLKYAYYMGFGGNCGTGNAWYCVTVDGTDGSNVGRVVSFHAPANVTDTLQFAYYDATNGRLKYARNVSGGNCGPGNSFQCDDIEYIGTGLTQAGISLALDSYNHPLIAYMSAHVPTGRDLKVAQPASVLGLPYGNCGPTPDLFDTWQCTTVDDSGYMLNATYASIAFDPESDLAMIAYSALTTLGATDLMIAEQRLAVYLPLVLKNSP